jgi:hypothetical protein
LLSARWRVLLNRIETDASTGDKIVKAACALHNYILDEAGPVPLSMVDHGLWLEENGRWRRAGRMEQSTNINQQHAKRAREEALDIRFTLKKYF